MQRNHVLAQDSFSTQKIEAKILHSVELKDDLQDVFFLQSGKIMSLTHSGLVKVWDFSIMSDMDEDLKSISSKTEKNCIFTHQINFPETKKIKYRARYPTYYFHHLNVMQCLLPEGPVLSKINDKVKCLTSDEEFTFRALYKDNSLIKYTNYCAEIFNEISKHFQAIGEDQYIIPMEEIKRIDIGNNWYRNKKIFNLAVLKNSQHQLSLSYQIPISGSVCICPIGNKLITANGYNIKIWHKDSNSKLSLSYRIKSSDHYTEDEFFSFRCCTGIFPLSDEDVVLVFNSMDAMLLIKLNLNTKIVIEMTYFLLRLKRAIIELKRIMLSIDQTTFLIKSVDYKNKEHHLIFDAEAMTLHELEIEPGFSCVDVYGDDKLLITNSNEFKLIEVPQLKKRLEFISSTIKKDIYDVLSIPGLPELIGAYVGSDLKTNINPASFFGKSIGNTLDKPTFSIIETPNKEAPSKCSIR